MRSFVRQIRRTPKKKKKKNYSVYITHRFPGAPRDYKVVCTRSKLAFPHIRGLQIASPVPALISEKNCPARESNSYCVTAGEPVIDVLSIAEENRRYAALCSAPSGNSNELTRSRSENREAARRWRGSGSIFNEFP